MKRFFNHLLTLVFAAGIASNINAQCISASQFGTGSFGPCAVNVTATTCAYAGEYSVFNGLTLVRLTSLLVLVEQETS